MRSEVNFDVDSLGAGLTVRHFASLQFWTMLTQFFQTQGPNLSRPDWIGARFDY